MLFWGNLISSRTTIMMKDEFLKFLINFCRKYKKEILWWILFLIVSQRIDYDRFAYKPEDYERELAKNYERKKRRTKRKHNKFTESEED